LSECHVNCLLKEKGTRKDYKNEQCKGSIVALLFLL